VFTSAIVSVLRLQGGWERQIAVFFSGVKHAGENLADVLKQRAAELPPPIQMCDALSRNVPKGFAVILGNCLAHYLDYGIIRSECGFGAQADAGLGSSECALQIRRLTSFRGTLAVLAMVATSEEPQDQARLASRKPPGPRASFEGLS
jgi:hypothetical protein